MRVCLHLILSSFGNSSTWIESLIGAHRIAPVGVVAATLEIEISMIDQRVVVTSDRVSVLHSIMVAAFKLPTPLFVR